MSFRMYFLAGVLLLEATAFVCEAEPGSAPERGESTPRITLQLITGASGRPLAGASARLQPVNPANGRIHQLISDDLGSLVISQAAAYGVWPVWTVVVEGHAPVVVDLTASASASGQLTAPVKLERAASGGGRILDEEGNPVSGAQIIIHPENGDSGNWFLPERVHVEVSDREGYWHCAHLPGDPGPQRILVVHPSFAPLTAHADGAPGRASFRFEELLQERSRLFLDRGREVAGRVVDSAGRPVEGARIVSSQYPVWTTADGGFSLRMPEEGAIDVWVGASGYQPRLIRAFELEGIDSPTIRLQSRANKRLTLLDPQGRTVAGALVRMSHDEGGFQEFAQSDPAGAVAMVPEDVKLAVFKPGYRFLAEVGPPMDGRDPVVELEPLFRLEGAVVDAGTGSPVPEFAVAPAIVEDVETRVLSERRAEFQAGEFTVFIEPEVKSVQLILEAPGYQPLQTPLQSPAEWRPEEPVRMERRVTLAGTVRGSDGTAAAGAVVVAVPPNSRTTLGAEGQLAAVAGEWKTTTDIEGRFTISPPGAVGALVAADSDMGFAELGVTETTTDLDILLQPWGAVSGTVQEEGRPLPGQLVALGGEPESVVGFAASAFVTRADVEGRFFFGKVPPGELHLGKWDRERMSHPTPVVVAPGDTVETRFPPEGWRVRGRTELPNRELDWSGEHHLAVLRSRAAPPGAGVKEYQMNWKADGSFSATDVPAGAYDVVVHFHRLREDGTDNIDCLHQAAERLDLPTPAGASVHDLGVVFLHTRPTTEAAEQRAPDL